jgi:hypothetical protein
MMTADGSVDRVVCLGSTADIAAGRKENQVGGFTQEQ